MGGNRLNHNEGDYSITYIDTGGSVIRAGIDVNNFRTINIKKEEYQKNVFASASALREGYEALFRDPNTKQVAH